MTTPKAILISDIHFNLKARLLASAALSAALEDAEAFNIPIIIAGDLHDTKAILRGECITTIINCLKNAKVPVLVLVGNHDKIHEKSEEHALEFLRPYVQLIDKPYYDNELSLGFIPYQSSNESFLGALNLFQPGDILITHQGFMGAAMGEYVKDESSVRPELVANFRVISGHYHKHQELATVTYIGTPYTTTFAEAHDGPKGFLRLFADGSIAQVALDLRKHIIIERTTADLNEPITGLNDNDLLWLKVTGPSIELDKLDKCAIGMKLLGHQGFRLDKFPTDSDNTKIDTENLTNDQIMDSLIDQENETIEQKGYLRELWRELLK